MSYITEQKYVYYFDHKSSLDIPNKLIKIAAQPLSIT